MSFVDKSSLGTGTSTSAGTTLTLTAGSNQTEPGFLVVLLIALDNTGTTDADFSEVSSVADSAGNTWIKRAEYTNGQGSAGAGATISAWTSVLTTQIPTGGTITATLANSVTSKAMSGYVIKITNGNSASVSGSVQTLANDAADPGSMAISGLTSAEYLFIRAVAAEDNAATHTETASYTKFDVATANTGTSATSMNCKGEFRILTGTGDTSDPTMTAVDSASVFFAIGEVSDGGSPTAARPIFFGAGV